MVRVVMTVMVKTIEEVMVVSLFAVVGTE